MVLIKNNINYRINVDKRKNVYYNISKLAIFTYTDYIEISRKYNNLLKPAGVREDKNRYILGHTSIKNNVHDKTFRKILDNKTEVANLINFILKPKAWIEIKPEDIEKYNSSFVTIHFKNQEADIVYKIKGADVFFLIEHQTKIDYTMPIRIAKYEIEIMESSKRGININNQKIEVPIVLPIVLHTGSGKWKASENINNIQKKFKELKLNLGDYEVIDINDFTKEQLLMDKSFIAKVMLIEKAKNEKELIEILSEIIPKVEKEENKKLLISIINLMLKEKIGQSEAQRLINKVNGGEVKMLAVLEMIREENEKQKNEIARVRRDGERKGIKAVAKTMLKNGMPLETIKTMTKLTEEEILKLK